MKRPKVRMIPDVWGVTAAGVSVSSSVISLLFLTSSTRLFPASGSAWKEPSPTSSMAWSWLSRARPWGAIV